MYRAKVATKQTNKKKKKKREKIGQLHFFTTHLLFVRNWYKILIKE